MLSTKLFNTRTFFSQAMNYFIYNFLINADTSNSGAKLTPLDKSNFILSAFVKHKIVYDWTNENNFSDPIYHDYVLLATFDKKLLNMESLKKGYFGKTCGIWSRKKNSLQLQRIFTEHNDDIKYDPDKTSQISTKFGVYIKKKVFKEILNSIENYTEHCITEITLNVSDNEIILLSQLILSDEKDSLHMYFPQMNISEAIINDLVTKSLLKYPEIHKNIFMYKIELLKRHMNNKNNSKIIYKKDKLNLHIDAMPTLFLYCISGIPHLPFFEEFTIQLKPYEEQNQEMHEVENFKYKPSLLIEFSKTNSNNLDNLNLRIIEYEYDKVHLWLIHNNPLSYININFDNEPNISYEENGITLHTIIHTPKTRPVIEIYFKYLDLPLEPEVYEELINLKYEITLSPYKEKNKPTVVNNNLFKISIVARIFRITLDHLIFSISEFSLIKSIVEKKDGIFCIAVKVANETIIESTVYLNGDKMVVISYDKLLKLHENLKSKKNVTPPTSPSNILNPKTFSTSQSDTLNVKTPLVFQSEIINVETLSTSQYDILNVQTPPAFQSDTLNVKTPSSILTEKVEFKLPQVEQPLSNNKKNSEDNKRTEGEEKSAESESEKKEMFLTVSSNTKPLIDTGGPPGSDHKNPQSEVSETTTPNESTKNISNSESEDISTGSEDTDGNRESNSGNTVIIISVVVGVVVIGSIAYIYFFWFL